MVPESPVLQRPGPDAFMSPMSKAVEWGEGDQEQGGNYVEAAPQPPIQAVDRGGKAEVSGQAATDYLSPCHAQN